VDERIIDVADAIRADRYEDAVAVFAAGSIVRGEGTPFSDLDLVVVYAHLPCAYRESFRYGGYPVEAFVHDPATLEYFFLEVDRPSGVPALPQMVVEGVEVPQASEVSQELKRRAAAVIEAGPPPLDAESERRMRYAVSDLLDDLRAPRSREELIGAGARLFEQLADYYLRRRGLWSAKGKSIARVLHHADAALCGVYCGAFDRLFAQGDPREAIRLTEGLLDEAGGPLFDGYRAEAPAAWRRQPRTAV
jgi:predicted nucleotidyltransferase